MPHFRHVRSGQTVLIIVLVMTIALTVGLSLINRTTTDIRVTSQFEDSARAFSAAEAGIEQSLATFQNAQGQYDNGLTYASTVSDLGTAITPYQLPLTTTRVGQVGTVFLVGHTATGFLDWDGTRYLGGQITLCWRQANSSDSIPAMEVVYNARSAPNQYISVRTAFDSASRGNGFNSVGTPALCDGLVGTTINVDSNATAMLRIRPFYSDAVVFVRTDGNPLPPQGNTIESTGSIPGGATRKITVIRQFKTPPPLFDYVLYSEGDIVH